MKRTSDIAVVLVTAPDLKTARLIAQASLHARLAACANLIPRIESHYWWEGKLEASNEILMVFKTTKKRLPELEKLVLSTHPYDTPEFIVFPLSAGSQRYLEWILHSVRPARSGRYE
jgi:periplasmic divalent cation tolerance protein